jgi:hypothetical protein|tara:strand:- start:1529 stop:1756 length:228 start_codon:yes stop_codon:yes gene_type:complete
VDKDERPHLKLIVTEKEEAVPQEVETHHYVYDPKYNYDLDMPKGELTMLIVAGLLLGTLFGIVVVGILWGGLSLL